MPFTLIAGLSLLLCLATVVLWVRSYFVATEAIRRVPHADVLKSATIRPHPVRICWDWMRIISPNLDGLTDREGWEIKDGTARPDRPGWGFSVESDRGDDNGVRITAFGFFYSKVTIPDRRAGLGRICVPDWFITLVLLVLPFRWSVVRLLKSQASRCKCGYDLTGNTSGVCPECGSPITNAS
jgi:hypothetical protein